MNEEELIEYVRGMLSEMISNIVAREVLISSILNIDRSQDTDTIQKVILGKIYDDFKNKSVAVAVSVRITKKLKEMS